MKDGRHVVLCIDDEKDVTESLSIILEANDYHVVTAESAKEGLELFKKEKPDMVLVDLAMETVDAGAVFAGEAKKLNSTTPIYLLSSLGDSLERNFDYAELGFSGVLQKPMNPAKLLSIVNMELR
jgi:DNA-binding response OmpR family regulator